MITTIRIAVLAALACALLVGTPSRAQTAPSAAAPIDPATWGIYTRLAGTTRQDSVGFTMTWHWEEPGRVLIEEYRRPGASKASQTGSITPGPTPGTLVLNASTVLGKKLWNGTVQPDGSVVYLGTGMLKMNYKAVLADDGAYEIRLIKVQDGKVVSIADANPAMTYRPSATDAAASLAGVVQAMPEPGTAVTPAAAVQVPPAILPDTPHATVGAAVATASTAKLPSKSDNRDQASSTPAVASKGGDAVAEQRSAARDFYERQLKGPTGKPGVWVNVESGEITSYSKSGSTYTNHSRTVLEDGTLRTALVIESVDDATGVVTIANGERRYSAEYVRESNDTFRLSYVRESYKDGDKTFLLIFRFVGDGIETTSNGRTVHDVWRSEAAAFEHQTTIAKLRASQAEVKRTRERLAALKAQDQVREMEEGIRRREAEEAEQQAQYAQLEGEREAAHAQWEEESRRSSQELEDSLQRLRDSTAEYEAVAKRLTSPQQSGAPASASAKTSRAGARDIPRGYIEIEDRPDAASATNPQVVARPNEARPQGNGRAQSPFGTGGNATSQDCKVAKRTVLPSRGQGDSREAAEADARDHADRACGTSGVADYGLAGSCTQQVGINGDRYWMCTPRVECNATETRCANRPSEASGQ